MITLPIAPATVRFFGSCLAVLAGVALAPASLSAQASKPAGDGSSAPGFSIETEMLTYRALEANSEAIACEVAAYLHGTSVNFKNPPPGPSATSPETAQATASSSSRSIAACTVTSRSGAPICKRWRSSSSGERPPAPLPVRRLLLHARPRALAPAALLVRQPPPPPPPLARWAFLRRLARRFPPRRAYSACLRPIMMLRRWAGPSRIRPSWTTSAANCARSTSRC